MRQVPKYLIIGSGRMATHFRYYLELLNLPFQQWSRKNNSVEELYNYAQTCSQVVLLISDNAIENFVRVHDFLLAKCCVHFSGRLSAKNVFSAHPLMTFNRHLYDLSTYRSIPFILEEEGPSLADLLPMLPNQEFKIAKQLKPLYHALIVMGNNFTTILWQNVLQSFRDDLSLPQEIIIPILKQTMNNLLNQPEDALTGPLVRNDQDTIQSHLDVLENTLYKGIYQAFVDVFQKSQERN